MFQNGGGHIPRRSTPLHISRPEIRGFLSHRPSLSALARYVIPRYAIGAYSMGGIAPVKNTLFFVNRQPCCHLANDFIHKNFTQPILTSLRQQYEHERRDRNEQ